MNDEQRRAMFAKRHKGTHASYNWRFREAKRQNHGYEQLMDDTRKNLNQAKSKSGKAYYSHLNKEISDAERVRPHKSFDYHWITRSVEEIIEENPNITEKELRRKAKDIHSDVTDERINAGIAHLKKDKAITESNGKFKYIADYIHNKDSR